MEGYHMKSLHNTLLKGLSVVLLATSLYSTETKAMDSCPVKTTAVNYSPFMSPDGSKKACRDNTNIIYDVFNPRLGKYLTRCYTNDFTAVKIVDNTTDRQIATIQQNESIHAVIFSPDSSKLAILSDFVARIVDANTGEDLVVRDNRFSAMDFPFDALALRVENVVFSQDGRYAALISNYRNRVNIVDLTTGFSIKCFEHDSAFTIEFSEDENSVTTLSNKGNVRAVKTLDLNTGDFKETSFRMSPSMMELPA